MPYFTHRGGAIWYEELGKGKPVVFLHGLLHRNWMQSKLAFMAAPEFRAISLEFSGHGRSQPSKEESYSLEVFAGELEGLLDHLELESAVVHGTSLGANVLLAALTLFPERISGAVIEMPVLGRGYGVAMAVFRPLSGLLKIAGPAIGGLARILEPLPRTGPNSALLLDLFPEDPATASAVLDGLIANSELPDLERFESVENRVMVIGHRGDPLHSFDDAAELAAKFPNGELVEAESLVELRFRPHRLWPTLREFYATA